MITGNKSAADIAHLMRRAGFGLSIDELEIYLDLDYESIVDQLVEPKSVTDVEDDILERYYVGEHFNIKAGEWFYRMLNSRRQLQEKMVLFWHQVFATGISKNEHILSATNQIEMFRQNGMSSFRQILTELSKDPAMIFWLDNNENRLNEPNENYGRELLELFSMGAGNYTENDVKMAAKAFTGWTFTQPIPLYPYGYYPAHFKKLHHDHDDEIKTFLGMSGNFDGEEIIEIIVKQPATAIFLARHLYNFFVADEPQVPAWPIEPPCDPEAIKILVTAYFESDGDISSILHTLFTSQFFKDSKFSKIKSPTELVTGVLKTVGTFKDVEPDLMKYATVTELMGQTLFDPPSVEGWHTGKEWIDGGTINERINFAVAELNDLSKPGITRIMDRIEIERPISSEDLVSLCLKLMGELSVGEETKETLTEYVESTITLDFSSEDTRKTTSLMILKILQLIVSSHEYQFA
tara:strand:+ start:20024 stop:21418 length:1395 start_codon:yes stop_codon:yes gene_type:complete